MNILDISSEAKAYYAAFVKGDARRMRPRKTIVHHGRTGAGPAFQRAAVSGVLAKSADETVWGDTDPSAAPVFVGPFTGPSPLPIDLEAYAGTLYVNPAGGSVNPAQAIVWAPTP